MALRLARHNSVDREQKRVAIGAWLKKRREAILKVPLREAAARGGCSDAWLCQLETADADIFAAKIESIPKLCAAYSMSTQALLKLVGLLK